jgi:uncharacterized BrkB/YihY/UPF0761 family membrane protein
MGSVEHAACAANWRVTFSNMTGDLAGVIVLMLWFYLSSFGLVCAAEMAALLVRLRSPELLPKAD